jgi:hypothetical protein
MTPTKIRSNETKTIKQFQEIQKRSEWCRERDREQELNKKNMNPTASVANKAKDTQ